jgi:hypothetical protein
MGMEFAEPVEDDAVGVGHRGLRLLMSPDRIVSACAAAAVKARPGWQWRAATSPTVGDLKRASHARAL